MDNAERLADDFISLEKALGPEFSDAMRRRAADILLDPPKRLTDCALDIAIEGLPVADRVRIQRLSKAAGYARPWNRDRGPAL